MDHSHATGLDGIADRRHDQQQDDTAAPILQHRPATANLLACGTAQRHRHQITCRNLSDAERIDAPMPTSRRLRGTRLPAPYLKRLSVREDAVLDEQYPFNLPWLVEDLVLEFSTPVTVLLGENGAGKSTLIEAIAAICGFDEAGGGKGYMPVDHSRAVDRSGATLASVLRASWLPKVTAGWFFRAETFFSVARYLDEAARDANAAPPDFLSWSHGEGFIRFFEERLSRQGLYLLDEPESALSPKRQIELLRLLHSIQLSAGAQIIMATHSPILMAVPGARLLEITHRSLSDTELRQTEHFKLYKDFTEDPTEFVRQAVDDDV